MISLSGFSRSRAVIATLVGTPAVQQMQPPGTSLIKHRYRTSSPHRYQSHQIHLLTQPSFILWLVLQQFQNGRSFTSTQKTSNDISRNLFHTYPNLRCKFLHD